MESNDENLQSEVDLDSINWDDYFRYMNFWPHRQVLGMIPLGILSAGDMTSLGNMLLQRDETPHAQEWNFNERGQPFSLFGVEVIYIGPNSPDFPTRPEATQVMGLKWPDKSPAPKGTVYISWDGVPEPDPNYDPGMSWEEEPYTPYIPDPEEPTQP